MICAALFIIVFVVYGNALFNQYTWDDGFVIVDNPYIKSFQFFSHLFKGDVKASTTMRHQLSFYYRPLSMFSFMVDYRLWRLNPFWSHLVNVLIHLCNCIIIFFFIQRICKNRNIAIITSLLFAVHPIHVEAVTPIFNRMGIQVAFFLLLGLLFYTFSENHLKKK